MPWCPKCKNEYREGITVCADCGTALVDDIAEEVVLEKVFTTTDEAIANHFVEFLKYSDIQSGTMEAGEEGEYIVSVGEKDLKQAKKLFKGFAITESENAVKRELEKLQATNQIPEFEEGHEFTEELSLIHI